MEKKVIYGLGAVALVGVAYYVYSKKQDSTKKLGAADSVAPITQFGYNPNMDLSPYTGVPNIQTPLGEVAPILGNSQTGFYSPAPGTTQDGKFTPTSSTENVTEFVDPMIKLPIGSSPVLTRASFDGEFSYADGRFGKQGRVGLSGFLNVTGTTPTTQKLSGCGAGGKCPACYRCKGGTCYPAYQVVGVGQPAVTLADFNNCMGLYGTSK